jgi:hypothetical protein
VVYKPFILLLGMFLGSPMPAAGQRIAPQIVLAHEHIAPVIAILPRVSTPLPAASFLLSRDKVIPAGRVRSISLASA